MPASTWHADNRGLSNDERARKAARIKGWIVKLFKCDAVLVTFKKLVFGFKSDIQLFGTLSNIIGKKFNFGMRHCWKIIARAAILGSAVSSTLSTFPILLLNARTAFSTGIPERTSSRIHSNIQSSLDISLSFVCFGGATLPNVLP